MQGPIGAAATREHAALELQPSELSRTEHTQTGDRIILREDDGLHPLSAWGVERDQLLHQRECHALSRWHVKPGVLQCDVRRLAVALEDAVLLLEVEQRARGDCNDELALDRERHADN